MKWLKKFESFSDFDSNMWEDEIDLITDSFLEIEDEFDIIRLDYDDPKLGTSYNFKVDEDCYYRNFYFSDVIENPTLDFSINILIKSDETSSTESGEFEDSFEMIKKKHPKLEERLHKFLKETKLKLKNLGNSVDSSLVDVGWRRSWPDGDNYSIPFAKISLNFIIKENLMEDDLMEKFKYDSITLDDIINCISNGGFIYSKIVKGLPDNDPDKPLKPVDVDDDGLITIEYEGNLYSVDLKDVDKVDYVKRLNESSDKEKLDLYNKLKSEIMELKRELKLYYFEYNITDIIYDEISKENPNMEVIDEIKNNFNYTKDEIDKLELIIEDNNDMNKDITTDLFCLKPFGDYSMIFYDDGVRRHHKLEDGKLKRVDLNLEVDPSEYSAYFGIEIEFTHTIVGSSMNRQIILPEMKSIFKLITSIESNYDIIRMILPSNGQKLYIYFKTK
jgi:hypothetical protein